MKYWHLQFSHLDYFIRVAINRESWFKIAGATEERMELRRYWSIENQRWVYTIIEGEGVDRGVRREETIPGRDTKKVKRGQKEVWE